MQQTVDIEDAVQAIAELGAAGAPFRYEATVVSPHFAASVALGWSVTELVANRLQRVVNDMPYAVRSVMTRPDGRVVVECSERVLPRHHSDTRWGTVAH